VTPLKLAVIHTQVEDDDIVVLELRDTPPELREGGEPVNGHAVRARVILLLRFGERQWRNFPHFNVEARRL
jgi:hypothetical protein